MAQSGLLKFDPDSHSGTVYDAFIEFIEAFSYEYAAIAKDPPSDIVTDEAKKEWIEQNKRKQLLGRFASRNLQRDFEDTIAEAERDTKSFSDTVTALKARYKPTRNTTLAHHEFHNIKQQDGESFDAFTKKVKHEANNCEFSCGATCTVKDILIRDQIIIGTNSKEIRCNALNNAWDLSNLVTNGRKLEAAAHGADRISAGAQPPMSDTFRLRPGKYSHKKEQRDKFRPPNVKCYTCSSPHCKGGTKCKAHDAECFKCRRHGHFQGSKACPRSKPRKARRVHDDEVTSEDNSSEEEVEGSSDSSEDLSRHTKRINIHKTSKVKLPKTNATPSTASKYLGRVKRVRVRRAKAKPRYEVNIIIREQPITAFADTGADVCVMSRKNAKGLGLELNKTSMRIKPYGSKTLKCIGFYVGSAMYGTTVANLEIYVVKQDVETLLSGAAAENLGIIKFNGPDEMTSKISRCTTSKDPELEQLLTKNETLFQGTGLLKDYQVKLYIDDDIPPVAEPQRPIAFHLQAKFDREIEKMEREGIIEPHEGPAPWVSNPVLAPKDNGDVRITIDMRRPNKAIKDTNVPIPRAENIKAELSGSSCFSKLDFTSAFHQLSLNEESKFITVFHARERLMHYNRLTMGTKPASGELTKALGPLFKAIPEAHLIHDDLIVATKTDEEHVEALSRVFETIKSSGLTLNPQKCLFKQAEIPFWGMIVSSQGVKPDPRKVEALHHATQPRNKDELISFLCMVQSNAEFLPNLSTHTVHLRELTKKHKPFKWTKQCTEEFTKLKQLFHENILIRYFNPSENTYLFVDAHQSGLSAILSQGPTPEESYPIACSSRSTTAVEQRYPQIDLEALAVDFALRRYRRYLVGGPPVQIFSDHKPLIPIFATTKPGSIRTERIKLRHQDISFNVLWRAGKQNPADYLSRHATPLRKTPKEWQQETKELEKTVWFLQYSPYTESISLDKIIKATNSDPLLTQLKDSIRKGYIHKSQKETLQPFCQIFDQLTISDAGLILKQERIILPKTLWKTAIEKAHQGGHPGMTGLKRRLRMHFWFTKLDELVEKKVEGCNGCQLYTNKTSKEPISPQALPQYPWQEVSVDLFGPMPNNRHIVVAQDNLSRFPTAKIVPSTGAAPVIKALDDIYTCYGIPETHRTDNGTPFNSEAFKQFSESQGIHHKKIYPYHPQANPVETYMKPLGKAMKNAHHTGQDQQEALNRLLAGYRSTPHPATGLPPGDIMFRYGYKTEFPRHVITNKQVEEGRTKDQQQRDHRKLKSNNSSHVQKSDFRIGQWVLIRNNVKSRKFDPTFKPSPCQVVSAHSHGLTLLTTDGKQIKRHCNDVKPYFGQTPKSHYPLHTPAYYLLQPIQAPPPWEPIEPLPIDQVAPANEAHVAQQHNEPPSDAALQPNDLPSTTPPTPPTAEQNTHPQRSKRDSKLPSYLKDFKVTLPKSSEKKGE